MGIHALHVNVLALSVIQAFLKVFISVIKYSRRREKRHSGFKRSKSIACGPGSSVGIATGYGLDGPGIESRWGRDFQHLSRPALGSLSLLYNGYRVFPGGKKRPGRDADHSPPSSSVVMKG